jgi:hypothetical protein
MKTTNQNSKAETLSDKDSVISISDLTEQELQWYNKRVEFFHNSGVAAPDKLLLKILQEGRNPNC